ncbi:MULTISPECIES: tetratricopeptide repeat protein [unclassified Leptolyngbya]|uniref:tetratricopeptide repeat protein n=1 Tax=unclassified Leptolyngbya TaxID=2650499 RepID=UPI001682AAAF|nr:MULTISPECIES: tetratricopeptide repeat protein [unclassified Leptolyngbya]MBD1909235.1 tetratricopeptide repeat protein [Leptolyngbya sp. FACHB-8]MBD2158833.1 tetratricopeptide repeat protein [Leptolyngbya sp. FACHB-16]
MMQAYKGVPTLMGVAIASIIVGSPIVGLAQASPDLTIAQTTPIPAALQRAYGLLGRGLVDQAISEFERYLRQNSESLEGQLGVAIAYRRAGRDADALQAYERVLQLDPGNTLALSSIGLLGEYRPEWQARGIEALTTLLQREPNNTEARAQRAKLYFYQGRLAEAIADYDRVIAQNPDPAVLSTAAEVYTYGGDPARGLELFNRLRAQGATLSPSSTLAYAVALRETGDPAQAAALLDAQLRRSQRLDENAIRLRSALAIAYADLGQLAQAEATVAPLRGRQDARLDLARALNSMAALQPGYQAEVAALYRQVLTEAPTVDTAIAREAADVLSGIPSERLLALQLYEQLVLQQPNDYGLQIRRLVLATQAGRLSRSALAQQLQQTFPTLPGEAGQLRAIAQALVLLDPPDPQLLPLFEALQGAGVNEPLLTFRMAQMRIQTNDLAGARALLASYSATPAGSRNMNGILLLMAAIDQKEGNLEAAAQRYTSLLTSGITDPAAIDGALQGLAGIRQQQGRVGEALAIYDQLVARNPQDFNRQLGRASLAYQANLISEAQATAYLTAWLQTPNAEVSPELVSLVSILPPNPQQENLYRQLLAANPTDTGLQLRLAQVIALRNPAEAEALIRQLIAQDPDNLGGYFVQGQLAQQLGNLTLASETYEGILARDPNNADALSALAGVRFQQRQFQEAERLYSEVLDLNPQNMTARTARIQLQAAQGRPMEARQQLQGLQQEQAATGSVNPALAAEVQRIEEGMLQQRGFQPPWERY